MKKLVMVGLGTCAVASALVTAGTATSEPDPISPYNVVGEPYGRAVSILKNVGVRAGFGGAVGSAIQQSQCIVDKQVPRGGKMLLMLNCTQEAADDAELSTGAGGSGGPGGRTVGANGVTTVTPTPVGPAPGMATPAAPPPPPPA